MGIPIGEEMDPLWGGVELPGEEETEEFSPEIFRTLEFPLEFSMEISLLLPVLFIDFIKEPLGLPARVAPRDLGTESWDRGVSPGEAGGVEEFGIFPEFSVSELYKTPIRM